MSVEEIVDKQEETRSTNIYTLAVRILELEFKIGKLNERLAELE